MKHEDIKVINVDNIPFVVDDLPSDIKSLVELFNDWRKVGTEHRSKHMMAEAALRDLQREIVTAIRNATEDKKKADGVDQNGNDGKGSNK